MPRRSVTLEKKIPRFNTDAAAERFVDKADLTKYDLSGLQAVQYEFERITAQLNMSLPKPLLDAVKNRAKQRGIPYTRFLLELIERGLAPRSR